jgi:hypothetical protein
VLVREPDQLGVERAHPQLAFGVRLVELADAQRFSISFSEAKRVADGSYVRALASPSNSRTGGACSWPTRPATISARA